MLCPAGVVCDISGGEIIDAVVRAAVFELRAATPKTTGRQFHRGARILRAALGIYRERTAKRVETEHWIGSWDELDRRDRGARQQIPVDHVTKGLVDSHAILKYRNTLWRSEQRRCGEAAKVEILLVRVPLPRADTDAIGIAVQEPGQVERPLPGEIAIAEHLDICWDVRECGAEPRQGRRADDLHPRQFEDFGRVIRARGAREHATCKRQRQRGGAEPRPPDRSHDQVSGSLRPKGAVRRRFHQSSH